MDPVPYVWEDQFSYGSLITLFPFFLPFECWILFEFNYKGGVANSVEDDWNIFVFAASLVKCSARLCPRLPAWALIDENSIVHSAILRLINTRSASITSLPQSANRCHFDRCVVYCLLIYIMLSGEGKYLKIIICHHLVIYFVMFYTYDVSNRPIPGNIADNGWNL